MKQGTHAQRSPERLKATLDQIIMEAHQACATLVSSRERHRIIFVEMSLMLDQSLQGPSTWLSTTSACLQVKIQLGPDTGFCEARFHARDLNGEHVQEVARRAAEVDWLQERWDHMARTLQEPGALTEQERELLRTRAALMNRYPF